MIDMKISETIKNKYMKKVMNLEEEFKTLLRNGKVKKPLNFSFKNIHILRNFFDNKVLDRIFIHKGAHDRSYLRGMIFRGGSNNNIYQVLEELSENNYKVAMINSINHRRKDVILTKDEMINLILEWESFVELESYIMGLIVEKGNEFSKNKPKDWKKSIQPLIDTFIKYNNRFNEDQAYSLFVSYPAKMFSRDWEIIYYIEKELEKKANRKFRN